MTFSSGILCMKKMKRVGELCLGYMSYLFSFILCCQIHKVLYSDIKFYFLSLLLSKCCLINYVSMQCYPTLVHVIVLFVQKQEDRPEELS